MKQGGEKAEATDVQPCWGKAVTKSKAKTKRTAKKTPVVSETKSVAPAQSNGYALPAGKVLVLRTCNSDLSSRNGFVWPESGPVECSDWKPTKECGNGLHGLLWGEGDAGLLNWEESAKWMAVEIEESLLVDIGGKVKYPSGNVLFCGDRVGATGFILSHGGWGRKIVGVTATAGYRGTATAGYSGTATAGDGGYISIMYYDAEKKIYRRAIGAVGENGIEANKPYVVRDGNLVLK